MITKTCREIIQEATTLANARNTAFVDFSLATNLLNIEYRKLYDEVVTSTNDFVKEIDLYSEETILPDDCYTIISVVNENRPLSKVPAGNDLTGYYVVNNVLYTKQYKKTKVRYSPIPDTLTAPDVAEEISSSGIPTNNMPYSLTDNNGTLSYAVLPTTSIGGTAYYTSEYCGGILAVRTDYTKFYWSNDNISYGSLINSKYDVTDYFRLSINGGTEYPVNVQISNPYIIVSYSNSRAPIFIYTGFERAVWNYNIIYGKPTHGRIVAFTSNDATGKGVVWYNSDDGKYYHCSFVPDTVLSYPTSVLFTLLEYRIAATLLGLLGMDNNYLIDKLIPDAEAQFYKTLSYGNISQEITNTTPRRGMYVL